MSEGFLSRWSKRKQEAAREEVRGTGEGSSERVEDRPADEAALPEAQPSRDKDERDPDAITPEELAALPPLEEVTDPAGIPPFLRKGVPVLLRNAAMRRMWLLTPAIRDYVDPAVDYAFDWNKPGGIPGNGPLEAGFDAKGAAERVFSRMRGRISFETGQWEEQEQEQASCGTTPHDSSSDEGKAEVAAMQQGGEGFGDSPKGSVGKAPKPAALDATLVVAEDAAPPNEKSGMQVEQRPTRRHGRALPV